ncbi:MAG: hypothetical protein O7D91_17660 [Planctomycetota bacterium]|nr:hypothetical protein [Planctomycetota bacterium]
MTTRADLRTVIEELTRIHDSIPPPEPPPPSRADVLPMVDCLWPGWKQATEDGLRHWVDVAKRAAVIVKPTNLSFLDNLAAAVPGIEIVTGIKTHGVFQDSFFDVVEAWRQLRDCVEIIVSDSNSRQVVFDNEAAMLAYVEGDDVPTKQDWRSFGDELDLLATVLDGRQLIWYPGDWPNKDQAARSRLQAIVVFVNERLDVRFIYHQYQGLTFVHNSVYSRSGDWMQRLTASPMPIAHFYPGNPNSWPADQINTMRAIVERDRPGSTVIVYPGHKAWATASKELAEQVRGG